jgi:hypothetical protein
MMKRVYRGREMIPSMSIWCCLPVLGKNLREIESSWYKIKLKFLLLHAYSGQIYQ